MSYIIEAKQLQLYYGAMHALKGIDMNIQERKVTALIGPSGCGKSTFLKTLNRMNDLVEGLRLEGQVLYRGNDIYSYFVQATTNGPDGNIDSDYSNEIYVQGSTDGIDAAENSGKVSVSGADGHITVTLDKAAGISVYTTSGTAVASTEGKAGANEMSLPCGMYIVKAAGTVTKVIVR